MRQTTKLFLLLTAAFCLAACGGKDNGSSGGGGGTGKTTVKAAGDIVLVSRLDGNALLSSDADATAIATYGKGKVLILDRIDSGDMARINNVTYTNGWYLVYNPGRQVSATAFQGSVITLNAPYRDAHSLASGGTWFTYFVDPVKGKVTTYDESGNVVKEKDTEYQANVYTGRLNTEAQVNAFGTTYTNIVKEKSNAIVVGTVENGLYDALAAKVTASGGKTYKGTVGASFTIFVAAPTRYWTFNEVKEASISGTAAKAYSINVTWK